MYRVTIFETTIATGRERIIAQRRFTCREAALAWMLPQERRTPAACFHGELRNW
jgi:hypothetical protein